MLLESYRLFIDIVGSTAAAPKMDQTTRQRSSDALRRGQFIAFQESFDSDKWHRGASIDLYAGDLLMFTLRRGYALHATTAIKYMKTRLEYSAMYLALLSEALHRLKSSKIQRMAV